MSGNFCRELKNYAESTLAAAKALLIGRALYAIAEAIS
jgi:hypothetical protein